MCKMREPDITLTVINPLDFVLGLSSISLITFQVEEVYSHLSVTPSQPPPLLHFKAVIFAVEGL